MSTSSPLPDSKPINLNGMIFDQEIQYDWKPSFCNACSSFSHDDNTCPKSAAKATIPPVPRNRSRSRNRANSLMAKAPPRKPLPQNVFYHIV